MRFLFLSLLAIGLFMSTAQAKTAYDFSFQSIDGEDLPLSKFKGQAILVVNTASHCGFTKQYNGLQALWESYRGKGLIVLGVPSNDFGQQEPGTENEIKEFCETNFNVDFPMTEKVVVSGKQAHPFYKWARQELGFVAAPKWNFHKYLIDANGNLIDWFATTTDPNSTKVRDRVEKVNNQL
jgi:glutathione peroxidase